MTRCLDWSNRDDHWSRVEGACRYCHEPTWLLDDDKKHSHKVCAERALDVREAHAAEVYREGQF